MWMMGSNEEVNLPPDSFNGRKLRQLVPRPVAAASLSSAYTAGRLHKPELLSFNPHLGIIDQSKRELNSSQVVVTSRWNPTPEQLQTLEELYQRGTRTPSADQIQHITSQLRRYGKIEGKNVFYWFQNHKARERQKRRRQTESESDHEQLSRDTDNAQCKESGGNNKTGAEIEETKSCCWTNNNTSASTKTLVPDFHQKTATLALKAAAGNPECGRRAADGWLPFDERELQTSHDKQISCCLQRNATWHMFNHRFTNAVATSAPTAVVTSTVTSSDATNINANYTKNPQDQTTLQLFPLRSEGGDGDDGGETETDTCHFNNSYQFFEFLPLKKG